MTAPASADWLPERYTLRKQLGAGGMGEVWLADDKETGGPVAIKRFKLAGSAAATADPAGDADRLRFKREFLILSKLNAPGIIRVYDTGESPGGLYYTMEYIDGWPLREYLTGGHWRGSDPAPRYFEHPRGLQRLWLLARELFAALAYLHAESLVHRDLKPANLIVGRDESLKLIDFGIARTTIPDTLGLTLAGEILGTPSYLAPEQIRAQPFDARADLYAVGIILYELATGQNPFRAASMPEVLLAHVLRAPEPPRVHNLLISPEHNAFILRLLAKEPAGRPSTALEALHALEACPALSDEGAGKLTTRDITAPRISAPQGLLIAPYTGNETARAEVLEAGRRLLSGEGTALWLGGPAGSGKTRMGDELRGYAAEHGIKVWQGYGKSEGAIPAQLFQPVFAAVAEHLLRQPGDAAAWLGDDGAALAQHFPALRRIPEVRDLPPPLALDSEGERARLLAAIYGFFERLAQITPLALLLDDLHWADPLSLDLAAHLAASFTGGRASAMPQLVILANFRNDEPGAHEGFGKWLGNLAGEGQRRLELKALSESDIARLIQSLLGLTESPPPVFTRRLFALTGGNPFFVIETLKSLIASGQLRRGSSQLEGSADWNFEEWASSHSQSLEIHSLPVTVQSAIQRRLGELSPEAQEALKAAALIGREFHFAWWLKVSGAAEDPLLDITDQALKLGMIADQGAEKLAFCHDQLRAALIAQISSPKRRRLHGKIFAALAAEPQAEERHLELLAEHAIEGGLKEEALRYGHRSAAKLAQLHQLEPVLQLLSRLEALFTDGEPMAPPDRLTHWGLKIQLLNRRGDTEAALILARAALQLAQAEHAAAHEQGLWQHLADAHLRRGEYEQQMEAARMSLVIATRRGDESAVAAAHTYIANGLRHLGDLRGARTHFDEAYRIGEAGGDDKRCSVVMFGRGSLSYDEGDFAAAAGFFERSLKFAEKIGYKRYVGTQSGNLGEMSIYLGRLADADQHLHRAYKVHREVADKLGVVDNLNNLGQCHYFRGEYNRAKAILQEGLAIAQQIGDRYLETYNRIYSAAVQQGLKQSAAAQGEIAAAIATAREFKLAVVEAKAHAMAAELALAQGEREAALAAAGEAIAIAAGRFNDSHALALAVRAAAGKLAGAPLDAAGLDEALRLALLTRSVPLELDVRCHAARALLADRQPRRALELLGDTAERAAAGGFKIYADKALELKKFAKKIMTQGTI